MDETDQPRLEKALRERIPIIAENWYQAICRTGFVPYTPDEVRQRLYVLTERTVAFLLGESRDPLEAQRIGISLGRLHYVQPHALRQTQEVLGIQLLEGLSPEDVVAMQPRLATLMGNLAAGFFQQALETVLAEQERIRDAFAATLQQAGYELRQAYERVEQQVRERTAELREANEALQREIAERRRAEQRLRESEERFRRIVENTPTGYYRISKEGLWEYVNPSWLRGHMQRAYGYSGADIIGKPFEIVQHTDRVTKARALFQQALSGETVEGEFSRLRQDGVRECYTYRLQPVYEDGEVVAVEGFVNEITPRLRAEATMRELERGNQAFLDGVPTTVIRFTRQGTCLDAVPLWGEGVPTPAQDLVGRELVDTLPGEIAQALLHLSQRSLSDGKLAACSCEIEIQGKPRRFDCRVLAESERTFLAMVHDITFWRQ